MEHNTDRNQSEWDMAARYLARLDTFFYTADLASMNGDPVEWFNALLILRRELSTEMKPQEIEHTQNLKHKINTLIRQRPKGNGISRKIDADLYNNLESLEMELRRILKKSGLQNKVSNDPRLSMG